MPIAEVAAPFDQRLGVRPGLDLVRSGKGGSDLMRRLVKGSPKVRKTL
jgi:hypothetical protein